MIDDFENDVEEEGAPEWIVTFADMMSLLLTFFILLLSFASMDVERFKSLADSMRESFVFTAMPVPGKRRPAANDITSNKLLPQKMAGESPSSISMSSQRKSQRIAKLVEIKKQVDKYIGRENLGKFVETKLSDKGLIIVNSNPLSFPPGEADLSTSSVQYLQALLPMISKSTFNVMVEGHTDDRPINNEQFDSNWELSTARASRFTRYLIAHGVAPERLSVRGFAEFRPVAPNDTKENRAKNRRIEILLGFEDTGQQLSATTP